MPESPKYIGEISIPQAKELLPNGAYVENKIFLAKDIVAQNLPTNSKQTKCVVILFCDKGKVRYDIDGHTAIANDNDIILFSIGQTVSNCKVLSPTFKGKAILINPSEIDTLEHNAPLRRALRNIDITKFNEKEIFVTSMCFSQILDFLTQIGYNNRLNLASKLANVILQMIIDKNSVIKNKQEKDKDIFDNFCELVYENVRFRLPVSKYCEILQISIHTLEKIVFKYTAETPIKYIHRQLITRICIIAECTSSKSMTLKDIAIYAHFQNATALARFVKRKIKMTLSEYRKKVPAEQQSQVHRTNLDRNAALKDLPKTYTQAYSVPLLS